MGLMATIEAELNRRELFSFASKKKKSNGGQPPRKNLIDRAPASPEPQHRGGLRISRRVAIAGGIVLGSAAVIGTALGLTRPWEQPSQPESLDSLVEKAKRMEDEYKGTDLSNKEIRKQYTDLLADIFVRFYPLGISKEQLDSSIIWFDSASDYQEAFVKINQDPQFTDNYLRQLAAESPALTSEDGEIYINATQPIYQAEQTKIDKKFPQGWNPLKSLRLTLFHEFSHQISRPSKDPIISSVVDSTNILSDKKIDGFTIKAYNNKKELLGLYSSIDEASVELLSKYINTDLFHSFISEYGDRQGNNITSIMTRLDQLLNAARITNMDLARFHKDSNLKGFLLLLTDRGGINPQIVSESDRIAFGFSLFEALIKNDQAVLQDYINHARNLK